MPQALKNLPREARDTLFLLAVIAWVIAPQVGNLPVWCSAMAACLCGLDALVFTGGIGEHDAVLRAEVCQQLAFIGIRLDPERNAKANAGVATQLHAEGSAVEVWMVPTDEGRVAAQAAVALLRAAG